MARITRPLNNKKKESSTPKFSITFNKKFHSDINKEKATASMAEDSEADPRYVYVYTVRARLIGHRV